MTNSSKNKRLKKAKSASSLHDLATATPIFESMPIKFKFPFVAKPLVDDNVNTSSGQIRPSDITNNKLKSPDISSSDVATASSKSDLPLCYSSQCGYVAIGSFPCEATYYITGRVDVTLLSGMASINGYQLAVGEKVNVMCSLWDAASMMCVGQPVDNSKVSNKHESKKGLSYFPSLEALVEQKVLSEQHCSSVLTRMSLDNINNLNTALLFEGVQMTSVEWMVAAEDLQSKFSTHASVTVNNTFVQQSFLCVKSGVIAVKEKGNNIFNLSDISLLRLPETWKDSVSRIIDVSSGSDSCSGDSSEVDGTAATPKIVICGAKGAGKSTCMKYTVNRLLSHQQQQRLAAVKSNAFCRNMYGVAVIDCDVGQPEFNVPGMVSLHIIKDPVLTPAHLHIEPPVMAYFIGDVSCKNDPETVVTAVGKLMEKYKEVLETYRLQDRKMLKKEASAHQRRNKQQSNIFDALEERGNLFVYGAPEVQFPLLVNTDGWIRNLGGDILSSILQKVCPTDVLHISTNKDRSIGAFASLPPTTTVHTCDAGMLTASKVNGMDLRTLRFISYFLRDSHVIPVNRANSGSSSRGDNGEVSMVSSASGPTVYIRNGSMVDPGGCIAQALQLPSSRHTGDPHPDGQPVNGSVHKQRHSSGCGQCLSPSFSDVCLQCLSTNRVPDHLLLALFNGSLVGITVPPAPITSTHHSSSTIGDSDGANGMGSNEDQDLMYSASFCYNKESEFADEPSVGTFELICNGPGTGLLPCVGLGLVRNIDVTREKLSVFTSSDVVARSEGLWQQLKADVEADLSNSNTASTSLSAMVPPNVDHDRPAVPSLHPVLSLVRGNISLPTVFMYCPHTVMSYPYLSHLSNGEGGGEMKTSRTNLKRRSTSHTKH